MAIELRVKGPGLDAARQLHDGQPELVVGRDATCDICLPDPKRNVSRRHLSIWSEAGELHFRVLSVVNGVVMPFGEAPPGARGVLPQGQQARLGEYVLSCMAAVRPGPGAARVSEPEDPWAVFDREASGFAPLDPIHGTSVVAAQSLAVKVPPASDEDPFGDWGFESTFGPGSKAGTLTAHGGAIASDLSAFFSGLGLDPLHQAALSNGELEAMGRLVRTALEGLFALQASQAAVKGGLRVEDAAMASSSVGHPLQSGLSLEARLRHLFGGRGANPGLGDPEKAMRALISEMLAHDRAMAEASRAVIEPRGAAGLEPGPEPSSK